MSFRSSGIYDIPDFPPAYSEVNNDKRAVEIREPQHPNPSFESAESRQREFGILQHTMNERFKRIKIILVFLILLIAVLITIVLLVVLLKGHSSVSDTSTTPINVLTSSTVTVIKTTPQGSHQNTNNVPFTTTTTTKMLSTRYTTQETTTEIPADSFCTPATPATFLFAYSNDFDAGIVNGAWASLASYPFDHYVMIGSIRFDINQKDEFDFHNDKNSVNSSIMAHQPDSSLRFESREMGSDVLDMIDRYLNLNTVSVCGSQLFVLVKRYPNETEISSLVSKIRYHHVSITFLASYDSSGGLHSETLYSLASRTNGFCAFNKDENMAWSSLQISPFFKPYLMYSANPLVSGNQVVILPLMVVSPAGNYWFSVTIQDNGPLDIVDTVLFQWGTGDSIGMSSGVLTEWGIGNYASNWFDLNNSVYNVIVTCNYKDAKTRRLQIRVFSHDYPIDHWMPYDN